MYGSFRDGFYCHTCFVRREEADKLITQNTPVCKQD